MIGSYCAFFFLNYVAANQGAFYYNDNSYDKFKVTSYPRGRIVEFTSRNEFCYSDILVPGMTILPGWL